MDSVSDEPLEQRERNDLGARPDHRALQGVSETADVVRRIGKRGRIDPLIDRLTRIGIDALEPLSARPPVANSTL